jgi:voltage-gated potassium channel
MTTASPSQPDGGEQLAPSATFRAERWELLDHLEHLLEPLMIILGLIFLALLAVEYSGMALSAVDQDSINDAETAIYWVFVGDFGARFVIAPDKMKFLRLNWITALSLALPFLRPLRVLQVGGALPPIHLVQLASGANRGLRALRLITRGRQFTYLVILSTLVTLLGASGGLYFERGQPDANIHTFRDALWWAATLITTINSDYDPVSNGGRVIGFLIRIYALSIFGYLTASIASYLIGRPVAPTGPAALPTAASPDVALEARLAAIEADLAGLREQRGATPGADPKNQ